MLTGAMGGGITPDQFYGTKPKKFYNFHLMLQTQIQALVITDIILCSISMNKTEHS